MRQTVGRSRQLQAGVATLIYVAGSSAQEIRIEAEEALSSGVWHELRALECCQAY